MILAQASALCTHQWIALIMQDLEAAQGLSNDRRAGVAVAGAARLDGAPELQGVLDLRDLEEVLVVGDAQRAHAVLVPPLLRRLPGWGGVRSVHPDARASQFASHMQGCSTPRPYQFF